MILIRMLVPKLVLIIASLTVVISKPTYSHNQKAFAQYLGNEGVLIIMGQERFLFDPFFHSGFDTYTLVPKSLRKAIFANQPPFNNISAIFVSHAHGDHFDAKDVAHYLKKYPKVKLYAPEQAVSSLKKLLEFKKIQPQVVTIKLSYEDTAWTQSFGSLKIEALRIPHAGWPSRAEVENIVFRVGGSEAYTVMHMGDADTAISHYQPHASFFHEKKTTMAFVPYWFFESSQGKQVLQNVIKAEQTIGVHVPTTVPKNLKKQTVFDYFSKPGEKRQLKHQQ